MTKRNHITKNACIGIPLFMVAGGIVACVSNADIAKTTDADPSGSGSAKGGDARATTAPATDGATPPKDPPAKDGATDSDPPNGDWKPTTFTPGGAVTAGQNGDLTSSYVKAFATFQQSSSASCETRSVTASGGVTCRVERCAPGGTAPSTYPHAGPITFQGLLTPGGNVLKIYPGGSGVYFDPSGATPPWTAWSTVTVSAAGAAVPAFTGSIELPSELDVTAPANTPGLLSDLPATLSKSAGFTMEWGAGPASVRVVISQFYADPQPGDQGYTVTCDAPRSLGALTVPAAALSDFSTTPLSAGGPNVSIQASAFSQTVKMVDTWRVSFVGVARGATWVASNHVVP